MYSINDIKNKKILVIDTTNQDLTSLKISNENIEIKEHSKNTKTKVSIHIILAIFILGEFTITSKLIRELTSRAIPIFFLNMNLKRYAEIVPKAEGNYLLRQNQYLISEEKELEKSKILVQNKIHNQLKLLKELKYITKQDIKDIYTKNLKLIKNVQDFYSLQGIEGNLSAFYFKTIFQKFNWYRRAPTTKEDIINFLLDIGYTILFNIIDAYLNFFGFDIYKGFYHKLFFQRKSLVCDIMEPFRVIIDKTIHKAYNLKQINEKEFKYLNGNYLFKQPHFSFKYSKIFVDVITENKEQIYEYCLRYYRHIMNSEKYKFPEFKF